MAFLTEKGTFTKRTTTGTDVISHGLGESPKILIFWTTAQTATGFDANYIYAMGFSDGTRHKAVCMVSEDAQTMSDTGRIAKTDKCIVIMAPNGGLEAEADISAVSSTNFTVNWTTNGGGADIIHYQIFAGSDITVSEVNHFVANITTGNQSPTHINSPTDGYDIYMFLYLGKADTNEGNHGGIGFGFATDSTHQNCLWGNSENNRGTADTWRRQSATNVRCITQLIPGSGAADAAASFVSKQAADFTINWVDAPADADLIMFMGIKGGNHHVNNFVEPGSTGTQDITDPGFQAVGYMLGSFCRLETGQLQSHNVISFGGTDGTNEGVLSARDEDGTGTTRADTHESTADMFVAIQVNGNNITDEANHSAFLSNGFQLNWSNVGVINKIFYWAFGDEAAAIIKVEPEILDLSEGTVKVLGFPKFGNEILDIPEGAIAHRGRVIVSNEILDLVEPAPIIVRVLVRLKSEILDLVEGTPVIARALVRFGNEVLDIVENRNFLKAFSRVKDEILDLPEARNFLKAFSKVNDEVLKVLGTPTTLFYIKEGEAGNNALFPGTTIRIGVEIGTGSHGVGKKVGKILCRLRNRNGTQTGNIRMVVRDSADVTKATSQNFLVDNMGSLTIDVVFVLDSVVTLAALDTILIEDVDMAGPAQIDVKSDATTTEPGIPMVSGVANPYSVQAGKKAAWDIDIGYEGLAHRARVFIADEVLDLSEGAIQLIGIAAKVADEILDLVEDSVIARALVRFGNEILDLAEGALSASTRVRIGDEILDLPEARNFVKAFSRVKDEILDLAEGALSVVFILQIKAETLDLSEVVNGVTTKVRETLELVEGAVKQIATRIIADEILDIPEARNEVIQTPVVASEILDVPESPLSVSTRVRLKAEILDLVEVAVNVVAKIRVKAETLDLAEVVNGVVTKVREELDLVEGALRIIPLPPRIADEILDLSEPAPIVVRALVRLKDEVLELVEGALSVSTRVRFGNEILDLPEARNFLKAFSKVSDEILDLSEGALRFLGFVREKSEILDLPESPLSIKGFPKISDEILDLPESPLSVSTRVRLKAEVLELVEGSVITRALVRLKAEVLDLPEARNFTRALIRLKAEILDLVEGTVFTRALVRLKAEVLNLVEGSVILKAFAKLKSEILDLVESAIAKITLAPADKVKIIDVTLDVDEDETANLGTDLDIDASLNVDLDEDTELSS